MSRLTTEEELAEMFGLEVDKLRVLRVRQSWPHVRLTRFDVRFTEAQIEQIVKARTVAGVKPTTDTGLTDRSARRSA